MPLRALSIIDANEPFWQGWQTFLSPCPILSPHEGAVAHYLNTLLPAGFMHRFVPQSALPRHEAYESFIFQKKAIPTRDGLHDFFNGLCWLQFPQTKSRFNHIHQEQINTLGTQQRGKVRDMLTVIDENGFLLQCPDSLWQALVEKNWTRAFLEYRDLWQESHCMVFGHALLEKLIHPYKAMTAHAIRIPTSIPMQDATMELDAYLADFLSPEKLATKPYIPLQIAGIPHWSREIQEQHFYEDTHVFRQSHLVKRQE